MVYFIFETVLVILDSVYIFWVCPSDTNAAIDF